MTFTQLAETDPYRINSKSGEILFTRLCKFCLEGIFDDDLNNKERRRFFLEIVNGEETAWICEYCLCFYFNEGV